MKTYERKDISMNQELVRIMSIDEIEQLGILFTPKNSIDKNSVCFAC